MNPPPSAPATPTGPPPEPAKPAAGDPPVAPAPPEAAVPLTPEEQMALYEKDLQENDWGHQPC